jgi:hypothetical protein
MNEHSVVDQDKRHSMVIIVSRVSRNFFFSWRRLTLVGQGMPLKVLFSTTLGALGCPCNLTSSWDIVSGQS